MKVEQKSCDSWFRLQNFHSLFFINSNNSEVKQHLWSKVTSLSRPKSRSELNECFKLSLTVKLSCYWFVAQFQLQAKKMRKSDLLDNLWVIEWVISYNKKFDTKKKKICINRVCSESLIFTLQQTNLPNKESIEKWIITRDGKRRKKSLRRYQKWMDIEST
jgi:hypothetical protein